LREILNAIFYVVRSGCAWRLLPHEFPPWKTIYHYFRLCHLWMDAGYIGEGKGADWVQRVLGWTAQIMRHPPKMAPEEVMRRWVSELAKEGVSIDSEELSGPRRFGDLPRRWVVERTFSWLSQNRRMSKDYERLAETSEAFVYVPMTRVMVRRLARS
jgi:transposase